MSVRIGTPSLSFTVASTASPRSSPGPRNELIEVRLALSNEALKMNGTLQRAAIAWTDGRGLNRVLLAFDDTRSSDEREGLSFAEGHATDRYLTHGFIIWIWHTDWTRNV